MAHQEGLAYAIYLQRHVEVIIIEHINVEAKIIKDGVQYRFFKRGPRFYHIPFRTLHFVKKEKPDVVMVQGLLFPLQLICLRLFIGGRCKIIAQHHAERPFGGIKKIIQKIAGKFTDAYLFTSLDNARMWREKEIIKNKSECYEVLEGSTFMTRQNKQESRKITGISGKVNFLWVGRLTTGKDPITVLQAFEKYIATAPGCMLYMIYQDDTLLTDIRTLIDSSTTLKKAVRLVGKVAHDHLAFWYSAADYFVSGSHSEGSGFALIEAMACGCIPVITDIPSFRKIAGERGFFFMPGDADGLCKALQQSSEISIEERSAAIVTHFKNELSFEKIASDIYNVCKRLTRK